MVGYFSKPVMVVGLPQTKVHDIGEQLSQSLHFKVGDMSYPPYTEYIGRPVKLREVLIESKDKPDFLVGYSPNWVHYMPYCRRTYVLVVDPGTFTRESNPVEVGVPTSGNYTLQDQLNLIETAENLNDVILLNVGRDYFVVELKRYNPGKYYQLDSPIDRENLLRKLLSA